MPAATTKKASGAAKPKPTSNHASYQDMITDGIMNLKDRNGSSRQALKKYVRANNNITVSDNMFDSLFNKSLKSGVDKGVFEQPKGPSGGTKLAKKKPAAAPAEKKPAAEKKAAAPKKATATKAAATKKTPAAKKAAAPKKATTTKAAATKKAPAAKKAAPAAKKAAPKKAATKKAPAVPAKAEKPETVLTKTKSGRVAKVQKAAPAKKAAPKRAAPKKAKA